PGVRGLTWMEPLARPRRPGRRPRQLSRRALEQLARLVGVGADLLHGQPQADRERHESLLGPVMEVPLEPPPLRIARFDYAEPRCLELLTGLSARYCEGDERGEAGHSAFRLSRQRFVLTQRRDQRAPG